MHNHLSRIHDAAERSANLTRQLLAFARKQAMAPMVFDLNASVASMLNMLQRLIGENLTLEWLPTGTPCRVKMDPGQLDQILANLCVNARDAITNVGTITIKTALISLDEVACKAIIDCMPGDYVQLTVSDNGCGMDPETATHIFEPFYTTKALGRGTGLGLSTVYGIVKQNNGFIKLYSEPKIGSAFNIYLPHHVGENAEEILPAVDDIPQSQGETILMVEDDPMLQEMGGLMLRHLGYTILSAATPREAIQLAKENATGIGLFLTDVVMPEMNGRELAEKLIQICPQAKHLFMSGYTANIIVHRGILDEGINFIQKPFSLKDLALKIRTVMDRNEDTVSE
ncbi:ATP-binding protein [Desulfosarcina cetonica]|uniref:ATP-binding protein n=1 Tax=Desulfosarcina cetonica TaxID=90730 RepID=UPI0006CFA6DA|nr:ATP-binding protein [Desulfosarcina cetonica]